MKQILLITLLPFLAYCCLAQNNIIPTHYFHKIYGLDNHSLQMIATLPIEDGYLVTGFGYTDSSTRGIYLKKLDLYGNEIWTANLDTSTTADYLMLTQLALLETVDNNYVISASKDRIPNELPLDVMLIKCTGTGEVIWKKTYGTEANIEGGSGVIQTKDLGFLIFGNYNSINGHLQGYCLKTDEQGNELWTKTYAFDENTHSKILSAVETPNHTYLLSGYGHFGDKGYEMFIQKIDNLGNVIWTQNYGSWENDGGMMITILPNNEYLALGAMRQYNKNRTYLAKLDSLGNIIWYKRYTRGDHFSPAPIPLRSLPNNEFIGISLHENEFFKPNAILIKYNAEGDTLWTREFKTNDLEQNYIRDLKVTSDGGFIATGFTYGPTFKGWIFKTDHLGRSCGYLNCDSLGFTDTTHIPPPPPVGFSGGEIASKSFKIIPNFITHHSSVTIQFPSLSTYSNVVLRIFDSTGKFIKESTIKNAQNNLEINTDMFRNGIYFCKLLSNNHIISQDKLVILR